MRTIYSVYREGKPAKTVCLDEAIYRKYMHCKHTAKFALYVYLEDTLQSQDRAYIDIDNMMEETGYSRASIYRALDQLIKDGIVEEHGRNRERWLILVHPETDSQGETVSHNETNSAKLNSNNDLPISKPKDEAYLYEEFTPSISSVNDTNGNDSNDTSGNDTSGNDTLRNDTYTYYSYEDQKLLDVPMEEESKKIRDLRQSIKKIQEAYPNRPQVAARAVKPLLKQLRSAVRAEEKKKVKGYYAKDFKRSRPLSGDSRAIENSKDFLNYFMKMVFEQRSINYYIAKTAYSRFLKGAERILNELGDGVLGRKYIDWFIRSENFKRAGWSLNLLLTTDVVNQFRAADPRESRVGMSEGFVSGKQEIEEISRKARRF